MRLRFIPVLISLLLATLACNFGARPTATPVPVPTFTTTPGFIDARGTPDSPAATTVAGVSTAVPTAAGCMPRADWQTTYTVAAGDTLGSLAQRTGSTTAALTQANCLANPDVLSAGQTLRVPRAPTAALPPVVLPTTTCPPTGNDNPALPVVISPHLAFDRNTNCYVLQPNATVTVSWAGAPLNFTEVTFYRRSDQMSRSDVIGTDTFAGDGAAITWVVPPNTMPPSVMWAIAVAPNINATESNIVGVIVSQ